MAHKDIRKKIGKNNNDKSKRIFENNQSKKNEKPMSRKVVDKTNSSKFIQNSVEDVIIRVCHIRNS